MFKFVPEFRIIINEGKLETAKSFKKLGVPIETIIEATGLTKEEIERL